MVKYIAKKLSLLLRVISRNNAGLNNSQVNSTKALGKVSNLEHTFKMEIGMPSTNFTCRR